MFKLNKNDQAFRELSELAKAQNKPLKELLLDPQHEEKVCEIFYQHMPKMVKWSMNFEKFKVFYANNKETFVAHIGG